MKFKFFKDRVNKLIDERDALAIKRQKINDAKNLANSRIEDKIKKLENEAWKNQIAAVNQIEEVNRQMERVERNIISEKEYVNSVSTYAPEDIQDGVRASFSMQIPSDVVTGRGNLAAKRAAERAAERATTAEHPTHPNVKKV